MAIRRERFVTTKQFLDSARSLDITPIEGFYELFDNSFDADATSIRCLLYTSPSPRDGLLSRMPSSA